MKSFFTILLTAVFLHLSAAQTVCVIVEGEGATKREASLNALQTALEDTYGTFISASTVMENGKITTDEIFSVCQGNICSYREVSCLTDSIKTSVILDVTVSVDKFVSYINNHGGTAYINGKAFACNEYIRRFNRNNVVKILTHFTYKLDAIAHNMYNYRIHACKPVYNGKNVCIDVSVECIPSEQMLEFKNVLNNTWSEIQPYIDTNDKWITDRFNALVYGMYRWNCYNFVIVDNMGNEVTTVIEDSILTQNAHTLFCEKTAGIGYIYFISKGPTIGKSSLREPVLKYCNSRKSGFISLQIKYDLQEFENIQKIEIYPC